MALPSLRDFTSGAMQGWNTGQSMFDAGVAGLARGAGFVDTARDWEQSADEQAREAAQYANPGTQVAPWREGGGGLANAAPWLVNQAGQLVGGVAPLVAGGLAGMAAAPLIPEAVGGAALASGLGMGLASFPQAVGANYQAERDANEAQGLGEVTPEQARSAAAWGVPSAALNAFAPTKAIGIGQTAAGMASRTMLEAAKDVAKVGIDNALATGGQKAIEHSFRPDLSDDDKQKDMFDSIVTGFIGGAGMGVAGEGAGRIIKAVRGDTPTQDLDTITKSILEPEKAAQDAVQERGPEGILPREPAEAGEPMGGGDAFGQEAAAAAPQGIEGNVSFFDEGQAAPQPQELSPPDVPKQYLVEAERALRDGTINDRLAAAEQGGDTLRSRALQHMKNFLVDENGWLAWHGSPHKYDEVDTSKIGTGEGAQAYGRGFYAAEAPEVAKEYQQRLADIDASEFDKIGIPPREWNAAKMFARSADISQPDAAARDFAAWTGRKVTPELVDAYKNTLANRGYLYKLDIQPEKEKFLDWDKPLHQQDESVRRAFGWTPEAEAAWHSARKVDDNALLAALEGNGEYKSTTPPVPDGLPSLDKTGAEIVGGNSVFDSAADAAKAEKLKALGIPGIRYFDGVSRENGEGTRNYVVFDGNNVKVLERNGERIAPKTPEIVRNVGGAVAKFAETPNGIERIPTPDAFKQPVDMPAGTPPIEGPKGVAPAVPPAPPPRSIAPLPMDSLSSMPVDAPKTVKTWSLKAAKQSAAKFLGDESGALRLPLQRSSDGAPLRTPDDINTALKDTITQLDDTRLGIGERMRQLGMWVTTRRYQDETYGQLMPSQLVYSKSVDHRSAITARMQALSSANQVFASSFAKTDRAAFDKTMNVDRAYKLGIDPSKPWEAQPERIRKGDNARYKELHRAAQADLSNLVGTGKTALLDAMRDQYETHWASKPAAVLYMLLKDEELPDNLRQRLVDPSEALINNPDEALTPSMANRHFVNSLDDMMSIAKEYLDSQEKIETQKVLSRSKTEKAKERQFMAGVSDPGLKKDFDKLLKTGEDFKVKTGEAAPESILRTFVKEIENQKGKLKEVPYSALIRHGKYGLGFRIALDEAGNVREDALANIRKSVMDAGFRNVVIEPIGDQNYVFIRSDSQSQVNNLKKALVAHEAAGEILKDDFKVGTMDAFDKSPAASKVVSALIKKIKSDDRFKAPEGASDDLKKALAKRQAQMVAALNDMMVDLVPETSAAKSEARRDYIAGFEGDPLRALAKQSIENAQHVSNLLGTARVQDALTQMRSEWEAAKDPLNENNAYEPLMAALYANNVKREEGRGMDMAAPSMIDKLQGLNYSYFLGFNPSFALIQTMQVPMYVIPELAKRHGYVKSSKAIGSVTMDAVRVMKAVYDEARKIGGNAVADMPITTEALVNAGLKDDVARFMVHMVNSGGIDTGGISRSLGRIADARVGGTWDSFTRWAAFMGYYAETFTRVQTALAAQHLFKGDVSTPEGWNKMIDYSHKIINQGLFDYANENKAIAFNGSDKSLLGGATKLATAFQSYWFMALEKMYREMHSMMVGMHLAKKRPGVSDAQAKIEAKEAAKFLLGHAAATSVVAGSLGLAGVNFAAGLYDKLADLADPEDGPHDIREGWSSWLEKVFGSKVGDAIAHGAPRLLGMDISSRVGEADYVPFSTFINDRDTMRHAVRNQAVRLWGAPEGGLENLAGAIDKFNAGDLKGAMIDVLPAAGLRNTATAMREASSGKFRDTRGHTIPNVEVTPETVASRAIGFRPTALARHQEENQTLKRYDMTIELNARNIVAPMVEALRDGDQVAFNRMLPKAREFERMHPGHKIVDRAQETFKREYKELNTAEKTGMPYQRWKDDPKRKERASRYVEGIREDRGF